MDTLRARSIYTQLVEKLHEEAITPEDKDAIGELMKQLRASLSLSLNGFAHCLEVSFSTVIRWEKGSKPGGAVPRVSILRKMEELLTNIEQPDRLLIAAAEASEDYQVRNLLDRPTSVQDRSQVRECMKLLGLYTFDEVAQVIYEDGQLFIFSSGILPAQTSGAIREPVIKALRQRKIMISYIYRRGSQAQASYRTMVDLFKKALQTDPQRPGKILGYYVRSDRDIEPLNYGYQMLLHISQNRIKGFIPFLLSGKSQDWLSQIFDDSDMPQLLWVELDSRDIEICRSYADALGYSHKDNNSYEFGEEHPFDPDLDAQELVIASAETIADLEDKTKIRRNITSMGASECVWEFSPQQF